MEAAWATEAPPFLQELAQELVWQTEAQLGNEGAICSLIVSAELLMPSLPQDLPLVNKSPST